MLDEVAIPPDNATGEPTFVPSTANCTVPVAVFGDIVAVKVTDWPDVDGFCEEDTDVVVSCFTTCVTLFEVLTASFVSPEYAAVMV